MIPLLDLEAPIIPAGGLGGFEVGVPLARYELLLREDHQAVEPRTHGLWQVVFRMGQLYTLNDEENQAFFAASADWSRRRRAGEEVDLREVVEHITPPRSEPAVDLWVDVRDGLIDAVTALPGYRGSLGVIRAGMTLSEVCAADSRVDPPSFLDETEIEGVDGVRLWFEPADPADEDRPDARLEGIVVFDPNRSQGGVKPF